MEPGTTAAAGGLLILFVWVYAALVLAERRWGLVLVLIASVLASAVPILHMQGAGLVGGRIAPSSPGAFFWVWTNIALGVSGLVSFALAAQALLTRRPPAPAQRAAAPGA